MKNYLTSEGFQRLRSELTQLVKEERPKVVQQVGDAAAMGDRSENAEYIYGKRRLREIDRRIHFLEGRLEDVEIIDVTKIPIDRVVFGVVVELKSDSGEKSSFQLVGQDELDSGGKRISFQSPVGRALLGKQVGDVVLVKVPRGESELEIVEIRRPTLNH
jgi:transcription elongation factor GreB